MHTFPLFKFGIVGLGTAAIYFFVMWIALSKLSINYLISVSIAYITSTIFHFLANRHFTFGVISNRGFRQLIRYFGLWIFNYTVTLLVVFFCVEELHWSSYVGVFVSVVVTFLSGYFMAKHWVFSVSH